MGMLVSGLRADASDAIFNFNSTRLLKYERSLNHIMLSQWMFEFHEHDVVRARLELDGLTRFDLNATFHFVHS